MPYKDPLGNLYDNIPQRWRYNGRIFELAGNIKSAIRHGWVEITPTEEEQKASIEAANISEAITILSSPEALEAVQKVIKRISDIGALGVNMSEWTIQGVIEAAELARQGTDLEKSDKLTWNSGALMGEWLRVIFHCKGEIKEADRLWPYLYEQAIKN